MAIKKLQQNFTSTEQSKRLLELGLPADSADCFISINSIGQDTGILNFPYSEVEKEGFCPCWSVGRLIEIAFICSVYKISTIDFWCDDAPMDDIIYEFENIKMDFSKLED